MKRKSFHIFRLIFALVIVFAVSFLFCQNNFIKSIYSTLFARAEVQNGEVLQNINYPAQSGLTALYVTDIQLENKEYDGTTNINIANFVLKDIDNNVVNDVPITATANTFDADAGENKPVIFNFEIEEEYASSYFIAGQSFEQRLVDILPYGQNKPQTLFWETKDITNSSQNSISPLDYVYNGLDQKNGILAYYYNIDQERVYLFVNIVKTNSSNQFRNEFIDAGSYEANIICTKAEENYNLVDEDGNKKLSLFMNKATPQFVLNNNVTFTYTGAKQSVKSYVSVNNREQTLTFLDDTFINLNEGKNLIAKVRANESTNYKAFPSSNTFYEFQVPQEKFIKRTSSINVENIPLVYTYTGNEQTIEHLAYIEDSLHIETPEQELLYSNKETFINCEENREIIIFALETENYNAISKAIFITINKAHIDTTNWRWSTSIFNYDGKKHSVEIKDYNKDLVSVVYLNNEATESGNYIASANFTLLNSNYEEINFPTINWQIKRGQISKPSLEDFTSTYTGVSQKIDIIESIHYNIENNVNKDAGEYKVYVSLVDTKNYEWKDGTTNNLTINWQIKKVKVDTPIYSKKLIYTGEKQFVQIPTNDLYHVLGLEQSEIGEYKAYLFLNDEKNYEWADNSDKSFLEINWQISLETYNSSSSIVAIIIVSIVIIIVAVYVTLHFTIKARRKRRRKRILTEQSLSQLASDNTETKQLENSEQKQIVIKEYLSVNKKTNEDANSKLFVDKKEVNKTQEKPNNSKPRKKRMLSMKKNDKKERRIKENKKLSKLKKGPAKRGRPTKKKDTSNKK